MPEASSDLAAQKSAWVLSKEEKPKRRLFMLKKKKKNPIWAVETRQGKKRKKVTRSKVVFSSALEDPSPAFYA